MVLARNIMLFLHLVLFLTLIATSAANHEMPIREYFISALDMEWNYLPEETPIYLHRKHHAAPYVDAGPQRIGTTYVKCLFRGYTDHTFTIPTERPPWLGILGPVVAAEIGDKVLITVFNNASHVVTFHTHGAFYQKPSEGAFTYQYHRHGNLLYPGEKFTYELHITESLGPTKSDLDCLIMAYHSHYDGDADIVTGLVGPMIICRKGKLHEHLSSPKYVLLFLIFDENISWYVDRNIRNRLGNLSDDELETLKADADFMESNRKYSINGLMYDNVPDLTVCKDTTQLWHIIGFGNEIDLHNVIFGTHSLVYNGHRTDRVHVSPGLFVTAEVHSHFLGTFSITSAIGSYYLNGMQANFTVIKCNEEHGKPEIEQRRRPQIRGVRHYYIAIEEILWDYAPTGRNMLTGHRLLEDREAVEHLFRNSCRTNTIYKKARYVQYEDKHFSKRKPAEWYMGILGPVLRAEVGEKLIVTVLNTARFPFNFYSPAFPCNNCPPERRNAIHPGKMKTYEFLITLTHSPTDKDLPCVNWPYTSNVDPWDQFAGLIGLLKTCRPGTLDVHGYQKDIMEYSLLFAVVHERKSPYYEENVRMAIPPGSNCNMSNFYFTMSTRIHVINGWIYGNMFGLDLCLNRKAIFNLVSLHEEDQMHVVRFEGSVFTSNGVAKSTVELTAGDHKQVVLIPDTLGTYKINCHVDGHILYGMQAIYNVNKCSKYDEEYVLFSGKEYHYFIAAEEVIWDYTPIMIHPINGENLLEEVNSRPYIVNNATRIGHVYKKVVYREYTDASFTKRKHHEEHLGMLGPIIRAEVFSVIKILFKNFASRPYNMQPQGLVTLYGGTTPPVLPGEEVLYTWFVPKRSGPPKNGFFSVNRLYYSTVNLVKDSQSGLFGMTVIYLPGFLTEKGLNIKGIREFATIFTIVDENESWYLDWNIKHFCGRPDLIDRSSLSFRMSNLKHSVNGLLFGSLRGLEGDTCNTAMIYLCGQGNVEIHTAHLHGLSATDKNDAALPFGHEEDVTEVFPGICRPLKIQFRHPGKWLYHCHVDNHIKAGMMASITVHNNTEACKLL